MVRYPINLSAYGAEPPVEGGERKIGAAPLYQPQEVFNLLAGSTDAVRPWTRKCIRDMRRLSLDNEDAAHLIEEALRTGRFLGAEWCQQKPGGPWAACDAYAFTRKEWVQNAYKEMAFDYYIKFSISKTGKLLLLVSCHLSEG